MRVQSAWYKFLLFYFVAILSCDLMVTEVKSTNYAMKNPLTDDPDYHQYLEGLDALLKTKEQHPDLMPADLELLNALRKRQIRYHPCYFNPVSCFRRKK